MMSTSTSKNSELLSLFLLLARAGFFATSASRAHENSQDRRYWAFSKRMKRDSLRSLESSK